MLDERKRHSALFAFRQAITGLQAMVGRNADYGRISRALDLMEMLPRYLDAPEDRSSEFRRTLMLLGEVDHAFEGALAAYDLEPCPPTW